MKTAIQELIEEMELVVGKPFPEREKEKFLKKEAEQMCRQYDLGFNDGKNVALADVINDIHGIRQRLNF